RHGRHRPVPRRHPRPAGQLTMWQLNTDPRAAHLGAALGYLGDDERAPTYRVGRALYERTWRDGEWEGPDEDMPDSPPDFLRAVCGCGWSSPVLVDMSLPLPHNPEQPAAFALIGQDKARAYWLAHALAATSPEPPTDARKAVLDAATWSTRLAANQPLAALAIARELQQLAATTAALAVRHARALDAPWEDIAAGLDTSRQQAWRKYKGLPALTDEEREALRPPFPPIYQHEDGQLSYEVTDVDQPGS
ncbi:hypothetical protein, partial [Streptomyces sp. NPDC127103]|uniref:hypothetical protein n=1 Tax=Streptomyces sp. NPDC127103 TaxID=3347139 RepID=UPI0036507B72